MKLENDFSMPHGISLDVPGLADYFGLWAIEPQQFGMAVERCNGINLHAHIESQKNLAGDGDASPSGPIVTRDGIAIFVIEGPTMKRSSSLGGGTGTIRLRQQIRQARKNPDILGGLLLMDTPGGTVSGNRDLCDEVAAFAAVKPLYQFTEDMTASAGVSVASQATKRFANNETALYGAMGTYAVIRDQSGAAEKLGVKVHVIKAGDFKGMGEPGAPVTEEQLAEMQRIVNALNQGYVETIARGLGKTFEQVKAMADGRVHTAKDALQMGLIDGIQTLDATYSQLVAAVKASQHRGKKMSKDNEVEGPKAASLAELKKTFPKSSAEWRESQQEQGATLSQAAIAYASHVEERAAAEKASMQQQLDEAKKSAVPAKKLGHTAVTMPSQDAGEFDGESGDAVEDFDSAVAKIAGVEPSLDRRQKAIQSVARRQPELYAAYLYATNGGVKVARLIAEKLDSQK